MKEGPAVTLLLDHIQSDLRREGEDSQVLRQVRFITTTHKLVVQRSAPVHCVIVRASHQLSLTYSAEYKGVN